MHMHERAYESVSLVVMTYRGLTPFEGTYYDSENSQLIDDFQLCSSIMCTTTEVIRTTLAVRWQSESLRPAQIGREREWDELNFHS